MADERSLQDVMSGDLFASSSGEMAHVLKFMENHARPLTSRQVAGIAYLNYLDSRTGANEYAAFGKTLLKHAKDISDPKVYLEVIDKMTLGDRIKGNVRMARVFGGGEK